MVYELLSHQINSVLAAKVSSLVCEPVLNRCDVIVLLHADTTDGLMGKNVRCDVNCDYQETGSTFKRSTTYVSQYL